MMEIAQLRAFVAVAEAGGFSRAATVLVSTQPTLSRQVKALEKELGKPLFDRLGRTVELTAYGRECLDKARAILGQVEGLSRSATVPAGQVTGVLRLGVADSVVLRRFPRILLRFQRRYPGVRVHVRTAASTYILNWVREGRCDAGLCMLPEIHPELTLTEIWKDAFVGIVPPDHELANRTVSLADFAGERQIAIEPTTLSNQVLTMAFQAAGLPFIPDMTFDNFQMIVDLVRTGTGVGIVSRLVAENALRRQQVAPVHVPEIDNLRRSIGLAMHSERGIVGPLEAFVGEIDRITSPGEVTPPQLA